MDGKYRRDNHRATPQSRNTVHPALIVPSPPDQSKMERSAANARSITATWDKTHGAPLTAYIDLEEFLADEDRG